MNTVTPNPLPVAHKEKTDNARTIISRFFEQDYRLPHAAGRLHKYLGSAFAAKSRLNKMDMLNLLYFIDLLNKLVEAAETLVKEPGCREKGAVIAAPTETDLQRPALYCSKLYQGETYWDYFPRHLCRAEYLDPYWTLGRCFRHKSSGEWKGLMMTLFYAAAKDDASVAEHAGEADIYRSCRGLFKLVEACHLIYVREREA